MNDSSPLRWAIIFLLVSVGVAVLSTTLLSDEEAIADDKQCQPEELAKLDENNRANIIEACVRRGEFKPSTGKEW